jgi:hypothetical protein
MPFAHGLKGAAWSNAVPSHEDVRYAGEDLGEIGHGSMLAREDHRVDILQDLLGA